MIGDVGCDGVIFCGVGLNEDDFAAFVENGMYVE